MYKEEAVKLAADGCTCFVLHSCVPICVERKLHVGDTFVTSAMHHSVAQLVSCLL